MRVSIHKHDSQRGAASFKGLLMIGGGIFMLVVIVIVATAPPPNNSAQQAQGTGQQPTQPGAQTQPDQSKSGDADKPADAALVKLPDGFRRFTNKQHKFSVAYPAAWGGLTQIPNSGGTILLAETKPVVQPLGSAQMDGTFTVQGYLTDGLRVSQGATLRLAMVKKDGKTSWQVVSGESADGTYRVGNTYPVASTKTPAGVTVYRFDQLVDGKRQARWGFEADYEFIMMSLPPLSRADGAQTTGTDLAFYDDYAKRVIGTVAIPK